MGRIISGAAASVATVLASNGLPLMPGQLPMFGTGRALLFYATPELVTFRPTAVRHRIRVLGGGGSSLLDGQSSSFSNLISATGGRKPNGLDGGLGGQGVGGDFQASGGAGGKGFIKEATGEKAGGGGGAAGSQLGIGGAGGDANVGGQSGASGGAGGAIGGLKGGDASPTSGALAPSVFSAQTATRPGTNLFGLYGAVSGGPLELPFFFFTGGGAFSSAAGSGAGGNGGNQTFNGSNNISGGQPGVGGGGGGGGTWVSTVAWGGCGYFGGGQGGSPTTAGLGGAGGGGFAMGEFDLVPGQDYAVTVAAAVESQTDARTSVGLIIVEW
ncbi:hypothetical protein [Brevundimonas sp.]|uniref:hypothetical protein n=1 Tax=Brevundimonas sp. TaxID=1871086 RepID=UPI0025C4703E|nr:hypothetical protein [Brevundimonas sp.]MCG2663355.1 hypothetical protein [Brevundimonas sp.]